MKKIKVVPANPLPNILAQSAVARADMESQEAKLQDTLYLGKFKDGRKIIITPSHAEARAVFDIFPVITQVSVVGVGSVDIGDVVEDILTRYPRSSCMLAVAVGGLYSCHYIEFA